MKVALLIFFCLIFSITASHASEKTVSLKFQQKFFPHTPGKCDLTRFALLNRITEGRDEFGLKGVDRSTEMGAVLETSAIECLKDYGIVQFIHGCAFESTKNLRTGVISKRIAADRELRGNPSAIFRHQQWIVDQIDQDALYTSSNDPIDGHPEFTAEDLRFSGLRYPTHSFQLQNTPSSIRHDLDLMDDPDQSKFSILEPGTKPIYFITDNPYASMHTAIDPATSRGSDRAENGSFHFHTCVYHLKDIPAVGDPKFPGTPEAEGGPIHCLDWEQNQIYNFETDSYDSPKEVDPFCLSND